MELYLRSMMFFKEPPPLTDRLLEDALASAYRELNRHSVYTEEYAKTLDQIVKLHSMKKEEKTSSVSKDTVALIVGNLLGILMIIKHENVNVITSKAMNLVLKPR
jgi:hypothetical protein